jgi:hypothetical protein
VSIKFLRLISFGGLYVQAIGFGKDHVKCDGEGFHYRHAHAAMVMTFEDKGCVTWCPKRLQDEDFKTKTSTWRGASVHVMFRK